MQEIIIAAITTIDIFIFYLVVQYKGSRLLLALWTAFLNILIPFTGFLLGEISLFFFHQWTEILSGFLLSLIGLYMLLEKVENERSFFQIPPIILAFLVSIDAFSVSFTLGMMQFNRTLFMIASGFFAFVISCVALSFQRQLHFIRGKWISRLGGASLLIIGIYSLMN